MMMTPLSAQQASAVATAIMSSWMGLCLRTPVLAHGLEMAL